MKPFTALLTILFVFLLISCDSRDYGAKKIPREGKSASSTHPAKSAKNNLTSLGEAGILIADTITYDVNIINPDPQNDWTNKCLKHVNHQALSQYVFSQLKAGTLTANDFFSGLPLSKKEVLSLIDEVNKKEQKIGKIQFIEQWQIDTANQIFHKKVQSLILGIEIRSSLDEHVGYKPLFVVNFP